MIQSELPISMKDKILTTEQFKENGFDFEKVEKEILKENDLLYFKEYPKDKKRKRDLNQFITLFFKKLSIEYDTWETNNDNYPNCDSDSYRSLTDLFLCCKYYYPECTLQEVAILLWNKKGLGTWYCTDIKRRIYYLKTFINNMISDIHTEDEIGFIGIVRNGRLLRENEEEEYDDGW